MQLVAAAAVLVTIIFAKIFLELYKSYTKQRLRRRVREIQLEE